MQILYGSENNYQDITYFLYPAYYRHQRIVIPVGTLDIFHPTETSHVNVNGTIYPLNSEIIIPVDAAALRRQWWQDKGHAIADPLAKLTELHKTLTICHGNIKDELPEQLMVATYLDENATVLELGANIGRNTCIIATILKDDTRLVTLESNGDYISQLMDNRNNNGFNFHVVNAALSKVKLIQAGWQSTTVRDLLGANTDPDYLPQGYFWTNTITFEALQAKFNLVFDTLVIDCEGAIYQILNDDPGILRNIKTIIIENDFQTMDQYHYVTDMFLANKFELTFSDALNGYMPCAPYFYQVYTRHLD